MIRSGKLRHRLELQVASETRDPATNEVFRAWTTTATLWASVEPASGQERRLGAAITPTTTHAVEVRGGTPISPGNRLLWGTRAFEIEAVLNRSEMDHRVTLMVHETPSNVATVSRQPTRPDMGLTVRDPA